MRLDLTEPRSDCKDVCLTCTAQLVKEETEDAVKEGRAPRRMLGYTPQDFSRGTMPDGSTYHSTVCHNCGTITSQVIGKVSTK